MFPEESPRIDLPRELVNLSTHRAAERTPDPLLTFTAYAQESAVYDEKGAIIHLPPEQYAAIKSSTDFNTRNRLVNKFGLCYVPKTPIWLHRRLADVILDAAFDMFRSHNLITVVMDGLRTFEGGINMQNNRPDLVQSGLLAPAGTSAHNRALAVDSKLFHTSALPARLETLTEADEHGHLDDEQPMSVNNRFYNGHMSEAARTHRHLRVVAWQRASVKRRTPIANLIAEFWDDRVPGSPADIWRVVVCRALCLNMVANPAENTQIAALRDALNTLYAQHKAGESTRSQFAYAAYAQLTAHWPQIFTHEQCQQLNELLGEGGGKPPELEDFLFHEWLETIHDEHLKNAGFPRQTLI